MEAYNYVDPSKSYHVGDTCPDCKMDILIRKFSDAGNQQAYCRFCGFWDYDDREQKPKEKPHYFYINIELDGILCSKRIPACLVEYGNNEPVRKYFKELGYSRIGNIYWN